MNAGALLNEAEKILLAEHHATLETAGDGQFEDALAQAVMREIAPDWTRTQRARTEGRRAVYLSAEYLIGRLLENNLLSLGALEDVRAELKKRGADEKLLALEDREEPALGNGGLGRLASCYLDSAAAQNIPLDGYGLRYRFGLFRQTIDEEGQHEHPDDWARAGDPWSIRREELAVTVPLRGENVTAVPYDMPVVGYRSGSVGTLRLWQTESETNLDLAAFHAQRYAQAAAARQRAETITSVLYPCDSGFAGQKLRAVQEYVLCSASMQDMLRAFEKANGDGDWSRFAALNAVQLNDTHPTMAIPELIRLLGLRGVSFDDALEIARDTFFYTNHTVMPEALECWNMRVLSAVSPEITAILRRIDERCRQETGLAIIEDGRAHMASLCCYVCGRVNGVAELHTELLKQTVLRDWDRAFPGRILNVTNGVTQRRWLALCNPGLTRLLESRIGDGFLTDLSQLSRLEGQLDDALVRDFRAVKRANREKFYAYLEREEGVCVPADFLLDAQVKRLHEYKRQLLNALSVWDLYLGLKNGEIGEFAPQLVLFAGKAYPTYARAKAVIALICRMAEKINADPEMNDRLRVVFAANYNCSLAEKIIPATDISEQISTAGKEASGTGNMKMMLSGAVTLGTRDGANVEIFAEAGDENNYPFGATVEELEALRAGYRPRALYEADPHIRRALDALDDGTFGDPDGALADLKSSLLDGASWQPADAYFLLKDFASYREARLRANGDFLHDPDGFARKALRNIAHAGRFSSDRSVREYAEKIWRVQ